MPVGHAPQYFVLSAPSAKDTEATLWVVLSRWSSWWRPTASAPTSRRPGAPRRPVVFRWALAAAVIADRLVARRARRARSGAPPGPVGVRA